MTTALLLRARELAALRVTRKLYVCPDHLLGWVPMGGRA